MSNEYQMKSCHIKNFSINVLLQYLAVCCLWVSKIHQFIKKLVDEHKIISDTLFFHLFEVFYKHLFVVESNNDIVIYKNTKLYTLHPTAVACF